MMAPLPTPNPSVDRPELARVRLEARTGNGRALIYEFGGDEFLIGGAAGCDLRLTAAGSPPVAVQLTRRPDGVRVRRVAAGLPVHLNGALLSAGMTTPVRDADALTVGGIAIAVRIQDPVAAGGPAGPPGYVSPRFVPLSGSAAEVMSPPAADPDRSDGDGDPDTEEAARRDRNAERPAHRATGAAEADRNRADPARWAEFEAERAAFQSLKRELGDEQARTAAGLQELARLRNLLAADRDIFDKARATFEAHRAAEADRLGSWEADLTARAAEGARREELLRTARDAFEAERARFRDELGRFERRTAALEDGERELAARTREVEVRSEQLRRDAAEWEETVRLATAEQERLRADAERLDRQRADLDARAAAVADRASQIEAQQAVVAVFRAKLDRGRQDMEREAWQLAAARVRGDESQTELRKRIQEAEELRAALSAVHADAAQERQRLDERDSLLAAGLEEIRVQREAVEAEARRVRDREAELDARTADFAEQAGLLKGHMTQALDLQSRLEADRVALREREAALAQSEEARQAFQEQLRRRSEDLAARAKALDEAARQLAADRAAVGATRGAVESARRTAEDDLAARQQELEVRAADVDRRAADFAEKQQALGRQLARLEDVGAAVAAERKSLSEARAACAAERDQLDRLRARVASDFEALRAQAPELDDQTRLALERLAAARDMLRGHLAELNDFARTSRTDLEAARTQVRQDAERHREQHEALDRARDEHRLAVAAFRQQLIEWQGTVADIRRHLSSSENRLDAKAVAAATAATAAADATQKLVAETDRLRREREDLTVRRTEVERHLSDMREWYRKKLRELAHGAADREPDLALPRLADTGEGPPDAPFPGARPGPADEPDPGDRQLGELLKSLALVDADTLAALWAEAARQRRTLRHVLLASGAVTLYQLALIEAGNLDALVLGRFRVIDRLRASPKEALYRVFDPTRGGDRAAPPGGDRAGVYLLRHLGEAEGGDGARPEEFRRRFSAARDAAHPHLAAVLEVLDVGGRPAALFEWLTGLFSADWPPFAAHPGCWVRLATMAAAGLDAAHRAGLVHGRLTSDAFLLTPDGALKVTGFGEPAWLAGGGGAPDASPAADLRAFGQVLFGWSQLAGKKRVAKSKAFPEALWAVVRRLEADAEPPMADTVAIAQPYQSAGELLADLQRVARETPFSDDAWEKLLKHVADNAPDSAAGLKKAG
jgi:hypothetical protein